jgi:hypothetical protein
MAGPRRRTTVAVLLAIGLVAAGCGDDDPGASSTTAQMPEAAVGESGAVAELDLCTAMGDTPAAAFLDRLGLGPVDQVQSKSGDGAAVCGWFLAPVGDGAPEGVMVRVEPLVDDGNEVCRAGPATAVAELSAGDGTGWVSEADGRVQAAVLTDEWCAYLRGPAEVAPGPEAAAEASGALLGDTLAVLAVS